MIEDGYRPTKSGSMTSAAMAFMRDHGVLKDIYSESTGTAHKTAKGNKVSVRTVKAPGFGPKGVLRCVLPFTVFLKLKDIGGNAAALRRGVPRGGDGHGAGRGLSRSVGSADHSAETGAGEA